MRSFTTEHRLQGLSVPEISGEFEEVTIRVGRKRKFNGRKLKPGPLLNAIVLRFLEMNEDDRVRFANESLAKLEIFLAESDAERAEAEARLAALVPNGRVTRGGVAPRDGDPEPVERKRKAK